MPDSHPVWKVNTAAEVIFDKTFSRDVRDFIHEGDFLTGGKFDIDWDNLESGVRYNDVVADAGDPVTNMTYVAVIGNGDIEYFSDNDNVHSVLAHPYVITRRFELAHTAPTAVSVNGDSVCRTARPTFRWRINGEDKWASEFGTTYTAFRIRVTNAGNKIVYDSGYQRMPTADSSGVYSWTAPLYVGCPSPSGSHLVFENLANYTWQVFTYNAKFKTDSVSSAARTFRMNVTEADMSSYGIDVNVCYAGPAANRSGRIHVQAFESPDFSGSPAAEAIVTNVTAAALAGSAGSPVRLIGLRAGTYYLRAYIDTDYDWALDSWESWGYLNARDQASVTGTKAIFNPSPVTVGPGETVASTRRLFIEDRDTDGDGFPDVWEAEQNNNAFSAAKISPVTGDAELIAVNTNLTKTLSKSGQGYDGKVLTLLSSASGVSLMTGVPLSRVKTVAGSLVIPETVVEDSVSITSLAVDAKSGEVVLGVGAETTADTVDPIVGALYSVARGATVTVKVYRTETLAEAWQLVAEQPCTITGDGTEVRFPLPAGVDTSSGFFKVVME